MGRRRGPRRPAVNGVLVVDKPQGITSFDVIRQARQRLQERRMGHTGTLDPLATGVLVLCVGEATKVAAWLTAADKAYRATGELGLVTDTLDITGNLLQRRDLSQIGREQLQIAIQGLVGPQLQRPPAFSAVRLGGERAYVRARRGEQVELEPRQVVIHQLELRSWDPPHFTVEVSCSKGTYIRSLVAEVGDQLGCGATLTALRRTRSGHFTLQQAAPLEQLGPQHLLGIDEALGQLSVCEVESAQADQLRHGQPVDPGLQLEELQLVRIRCQGELVALGEQRQGRLWPKRVFVEHHPAPRVDKHPQLDQDAG